MDCGVMVPQIGRHAGPSALRDVAQCAEERGFQSIWTSDHVAMPRSYASPYPFSDDEKIDLGSDQPYYELFTTLGFLSAVTSRVALGVSVLVVPYRQPSLLAKMVGTVDQLSEGRLILGVGVGWLREEFDALGADFDRRGAVTDESLEFLSLALASEQPVTFTSRAVSVEDMYFAPGAYQGRRVPIWVGGVSKPALRRTAAWGDAWFPHLYGASPAWISAQLEEIRALQTAAGTAQPISTAMFVPVKLTDKVPDDGLEPWERKLVAGPAEHIAATLSEYAKAGVDHTLLMFSGSTSRRLEVIDVLGEHVLPAIGGA